MGQRFLIDTNVIIDYTSGKFDNDAAIFAENIFNTDFNISVVVKIEALGYSGPLSEMELLTDFINTANVFPLDDIVTKKTIELRKNNKLKLGDAIIAATAIMQDLTLLTRNISDFKNIADIRVIDPYSM